jgi:hypothetical protein
MKRMLKRKIHPEFEVKMHKSDGEKPGETGLIIDGEHGVSESDNLLPTQGILLNLTSVFSPMFDL